MSRVLLVCPEPLGHGQPAGVGIRFLELAKVIRADGHSVTLLSADGGAVSGVRTGITSPESLHRLSGEHDVAVVQGHAANELFAHGQPLPTAVDLYDPFIVENFHYYRQHGIQVYAHDHTTLMTSLSRGDLFLCASRAQRLFYLGMLLTLGRLNPQLFDEDPALDSLVRIVPFGVQAPRAIPAKSAAAPAILFGGIYDWYDPIVAIEAVRLARQQIPGLTLTFTRHPNPTITPQGVAAETIAYVKKHALDFVRFEPWNAYQDRGAFFDRFTMALLTFPQSLETDLSMRTRIFDYLWGGLPVVTSSAPGTDEILERYGAGIVVAGNAPEAYARELVAALADPERYETMAAGTQAFTADHQWSRLAEPLLAFCRAPRFEATKQTFAWSPQLPQHQPSTMYRARRRALRWLRRFTLHPSLLTLHSGGLL
jgi:glycosyltransferase involved in cell wall biosynthesis